MGERKGKGSMGGRKGREESMGERKAGLAAAQPRAGARRLRLWCKAGAAADRPTCVPWPCRLSSQTACGWRSNRPTCVPWPGATADPPACPGLPQPPDRLVYLEVVVSWEEGDGGIERWVVQDGVGDLRRGGGIAGKGWGVGGWGGAPSSGGWQQQRAQHSSANPGPEDPGDRQRRPEAPRRLPPHRYHPMRGNTIRPSTPTHDQA